jgi:DNA-binding transcriptional MerR regulator
VAGPGAKYDDNHLARLRLIRRLQREHQPLADIRRRLETLDDAAVLQLAEAPPAPPADTALEYIRRLTGDTRALHEAPTPYPAPAYAAPPSVDLGATPPYRQLRTLDRSVEAPAIRSPLAAPTAPAAPVDATVSHATAIEDELAPASTPRIERSQWERISLDPDVELHVRRPLPRSAAKRVERLVEIAHDLFKEDQP